MSAFDGLKDKKQVASVSEVQSRIDALSRDIDMLDKKPAPPPPMQGDWTASYKQWSEFEDVDELKDALDENKGKLDELNSRPSFRDHRHEHGEERKIFELPEHEKVERCERHRHLGNYLFREGVFGKAAEQYQLAMSMYEYCFPDTDEDQRLLNAIRQTCTCNISLCFQRLGNYRSAVEMASKVVVENSSNAKGYYRRAQAYRMLDQYAEAEADLGRALELAPGDSGVVAELALLRQQRVCARQQEKIFARGFAGDTGGAGVGGGVGADAGAGAPDVCEGSVLTGMNSGVPLEPILYTV
jgi:tetratricopeptide (TPR) repeat protein